MGLPEHIEILLKTCSTKLFAWLEQLVYVEPTRVFRYLILIPEFSPA